MITIVIRTFAYIREILGQKRIEINISKDMTIKQVIDDLVENYPKLSQYLKVDGKLDKNYTYALDGTAIPFSNLDKITINESQELAILPPAGGG